MRLTRNISPELHDDESGQHQVSDSTVMQPGESRINLTNNSADSGHGSTSDGHDHGHLHHEDMDPATDMDPASVVFKDEVTPNFVPPEKISDLAFKDKTASILP